MTDLLARVPEHDLTGVIITTVVVGSIAIFLIVAVIAEAWQKVRTVETTSRLASDLVAQGFAPTEIVAIVAAAGGKKSALQKLAACRPSEVA